MVKKILNEFEKIDNRILKIVNIGLIISLIIGVIGSCLILTYNTYATSYDYYKAGFILIKTAITFSAQFIACGLAFNEIIKEKV